MASHVRPNLKSSRVESYQGIPDFCLVPDIGTTTLDTLTRSRVLGDLPLALQWDDIQFGASKADKSRHILVRHNFVRA